MCVCRGMNLNYCFIPLVTALGVRTHTLIPFELIPFELISLMVIAISAHTCDKLIMFPRGVFTDESYKLFYDSLMAVIGVDTFNMV